ncbi:hematopoietic prostaglandin D synthase-like [Oscarella lobularis]|uniref:hematopoietic prostaglandin D synthase-like n=1 Tax=Oscarella lobularis TaxID=121494 RepID=UPI00331346BB
MAKIVFRYFACQGRAEPLRLLLADSGVQFDDERVPIDEKWKQTKQDRSISGPFQCLPVLHWDSHLIAQTEAIAVYLSIKLGYAGDGSPEQMAQSAALCSAAHQDLVQTAVKLLYIPVLEPQKNLEEAFHETARNIHGRLRALDHLLDEKQFFLGDRLCSGDFFLYAAFDQILTIFGDSLFDSYPRLKAFYERMGARPNIKAYVDAGRRLKCISANPKEQEVLEKFKELDANSTPQK